MKDEDSVFKALSDPTRREILALLRVKNLTPGQISEHFSISKPSLSHHLDILKRADLVLPERKGQNIEYSLNTSVFDEIYLLLTTVFGKKGD
jgi:DNA-binding transcriptional ArsR family regulator